MDTHPLADPDTQAEFVTSASIGDIKTALAELDDDTRPEVARAIYEIETSREDETPRKGLVTFLEELLGANPAPPSGDGDGDGDDAADGADGDTHPLADPDTQTEPPRAVRPVTVDRDCIINLDGQLLRCKQGDRLTGAAAAYALKSGSPVTEVDDDVED